MRFAKRTVIVITHRLDLLPAGMPVVDLATATSVIATVGA